MIVAIIITLQACLYQVSTFNRIDMIDGFVNNIIMQNFSIGTCAVS